jgi:predicted esterase
LVQAAFFFGQIGKLMNTPTGGFYNDPPEGLEVVQVRTSAYYALQLPEAGVSPETAVLVVLHGWGQNARSFIRKFTALRKHSVLVVAPQAPHQFYLNMETRKVGFGWMTAFDRDRGISNVVARIDAILDSVEVEHRMGAIRPCLLGFSQGVSIAWRYAIHGGRNVSGLVACGGDLPPDVEQALPNRKPVPTMLVHGRQDAIVPWSKAQSAESVLRGHAYPIEVNYFDGGHDLPSGLIERLPGWVTEAVFLSESRGQG